MFLYKLFFWAFCFQILVASEEKISWKNTFTNFLKQTVTFKVQYRTLKIGAISAQGGKPDQEDTLLLCYPEEIFQYLINQEEEKIFEHKQCELKKEALFGVFDGHGEEGRGGEASLLVATEFAKYFKNFIEQPQNIIHSFFTNYKFKLTKDIFSTISKKINLSNFAKNHGTTACLCKISTDGLFSFYNLGDSRAIWGPTDKECTKDHSKTNTDEIKRCAQLGTTIDEKGYFSPLSSKKKLAVSRAFGDTDLSFVLHIPDEYKNINTQAAIIGCDGCFDKTDQAVLWGIYEACLKTKDFSMTETLFTIMFYILCCGTKDSANWINENKCKYEEICKNNDSLSTEDKLFVSEYTHWQNYVNCRSDILLQKSQAESTDEIINMIINKKNTTEYVNVFKRYHKDKVLHDNTSLILLKVDEESGYQLFNKERVTLALFFILVFCIYKRTKIVNFLCRA